jgi:hypothetical protein
MKKTLILVFTSFFVDGLTGSAMELSQSFDTSEKTKKDNSKKIMEFIKKNSENISKKEIKRIYTLVYEYFGLKSKEEKKVFALLHKEDWRLVHKSVRYAREVLDHSKQGLIEEANKALKEKKLDEKKSLVSQEAHVVSPQIPSFPQNIVIEHENIVQEKQESPSFPSVQSLLDLGCLDLQELHKNNKLASKDHQGDAMIQAQGLGHDPVHEKVEVQDLAELGKKPEEKLSFPWIQPLLALTYRPIHIPQGDQKEDDGVMNVETEVVSQIVKLESEANNQIPVIGLHKVLQKVIQPDVHNNSSGRGMQWDQGIQFSQTMTRFLGSGDLKTQGQHKNLLRYLGKKVQQENKSLVQEQQQDSLALGFGVKDYSKDQVVLVKNKKPILGYLSVLGYIGAAAFCKSILGSHSHGDLFMCGNALQGPQNVTDYVANLNHYKQSCSGTDFSFGNGRLQKYHVDYFEDYSKDQVEDLFQPKESLWTKLKGKITSVFGQWSPNSLDSEAKDFDKEILGRGIISTDGTVFHQNTSDSIEKIEGLVPLGEEKPLAFTGYTQQLAERLSEEKKRLSGPVFSLVQEKPLKFTGYTKQLAERLSEEKKRLSGPVFSLVQSKPLAFTGYTKQLAERLSEEKKRLSGPVFSLVQEKPLAFTGYTKQLAERLSEEKKRLSGPVFSLVQEKPLAFTGYTKQLVELLSEGKKALYPMAGLESQGRQSAQEVVSSLQYFVQKSSQFLDGIINREEMSENTYNFYKHTALCEKGNLQDFNDLGNEAMDKGSSSLKKEKSFWGRTKEKVTNFAQEKVTNFFLKNLDQSSDGWWI